MELIVLDVLSRFDWRALFARNSSGTCEATRGFSLSFHCSAVVYGRISCVQWWSVKLHKNAPCVECVDI